MKKALALFLAVLMVLSLAACGKKAPAPADVAGYVLDAFKKQDAETLKKYYAGNVDDLAMEDEALGLDESDPEMKAAAQALMDKALSFDYKLGEAKVDGDKATVPVTFTTYHFGEAFAGYFAEVFSSALMQAFSEEGESSQEDLEKEMAAKLKTLIDGLDKKDATAQGELTLTKNSSGEWIADEFTEDLVDAVFGNMSAEMESAMGDLFSGWVDEAEDEAEDEPQP